VTDIPAKKPDLRDDPHVIAEYLVQEHGLEGALDRATEGTTAAHERGDNYALSIWRDVKKLLRERGHGDEATVNSPAEPPEPAIPSEPESPEQPSPTRPNRKGP
jgi:hypothetical protein